MADCVKTVAGWKDYFRNEIMNALCATYTRDSGAAKLAEAGLRKLSKSEIDALCCLVWTSNGEVARAVLDQNNPDLI